MSQQPDDMRSLVDYLNKTAHAYYVLDDPLISDAEWDRLYSRLQQMEKKQGVVLPDSPSLRVGGEPLAAFRQHRHLSRLWSMDKAQSPEELQAWFDRTEKLRAQEPSLPPLTYGVEYKFDGLTLNLTYDHGVLIEAATRGNGEVGEAILPQARTVRGVPLSIPWQGLIEVQGECIMRLSALRKYNETAAEPLKNARNAAAGALRNLDPAVTAARNLSAFFYFRSGGDGAVSAGAGLPGQPLFRNGGQPCRGAFPDPSNRGRPGWTGFPDRRRGGKGHGSAHPPVHGIHGQVSPLGGGIQICR